MMSPAADDALRDEVRLLGGILGEVIRKEGGEALYEHVEAVRQASIAYHRDPASHPAKRLEKLLTAMSVDQAAGLAHSFALFSLLANIAEDRASRRRARDQTEAGARADTPEGALKRLADQGVDKAAVTNLLREALVSPVLTAHPSEVRRKSVIDRIAAISDLLDACDKAGAACTPGSITEPLRRQIVILWATRLVRTQGLVVQDEIETVVSFLDRIFLHVAPKQLSAWRRLLDAPDLKPFMRVGSWVGGDRDGNPNVDAVVQGDAFRTQSRAVLNFYLDEVHTLGAELSLAAELAEVSPALQALADAAHDPSPHRADEPYRRALTGIYARLAATYEKLGGSPPPRRPLVVAEAYSGPDAFETDLKVLHDSLIAQHGGVFADDRLTDLITAVEVFGFHMATLDLRQNSDVHERVVGDLLKVAGVCDGYSALDEESRLKVLAA